MTGQNVTAAYVVMQVQRYAADCRGAVSRVRLADRLEDVVRLADVHPPSIISAIARTVPEGRQLQAAAEQKVRSICEGHLQQLRVLSAAGDAEAFAKAHGRAQEAWRCLRGHYPSQLQRVLVEAARLQPVVGGEAVAAPRERGG